MAGKTGHAVNRDDRGNRQADRLKLPLVVGNIRKHSLEEYWNQGLNKVWSTKIVQFLVSRMMSLKEMEEITNIISDINMDSVLYIDLIENNLDDINLIRDIVDKME